MCADRRRVEAGERDGAHELPEPRELHEREELGIQIVGFIDPDPGRVGVPLDRLEHLYAENSRLRRVVARLNLEVKTLKGRPRIDYFSKPLNTRAS